MPACQPASILPWGKNQGGGGQPGKRGHAGQEVAVGECGRSVTTCIFAACHAEIGVSVSGWCRARPPPFVCVRVCDIQRMHAYTHTCTI